jgi:nucleoside 2-deoxyribosyltransferase
MLHTEPGMTDRTMSKRIYLAGPDVFLINAREVGARKRAICDQHGLVGVFPADAETACDPSLSLPEQGLAISHAMERAMQGCDAMIVNLTPFRGPSADAGVAAFCGGAVRRRASGEHEDSDSMAIEPFELHDNLMLAGGIIASGGCIVAETVPHADRYTSLAAFERCVARVAAELAR